MKFYIYLSWFSKAFDFQFPNMCNLINPLILRLINLDAPVQTITQLINGKWSGTKATRCTPSWLDTSVLANVYPELLETIQFRGNRKRLVELSNVNTRELYKR